MVIHHIRLWFGIQIIKQIHLGHTFVSNNVIRYVTENKFSRISLPLKLGNVLKCWNENYFRLKEFFGHCHNALISMLGFEIFITWIPSLLISFEIVVQGDAHFTWDCELCTTYSRGSIVWGSIRGQKQLTDTTISMHVHKMLG